MYTYSAYVTGAASGIGRALCIELGRRGGRVLACDLQLAGAEETAHLVEEAGGRAIAQRCDVGKLDDVVAAADLGERVLGPIDCCVNNAGVAVSGDIGEIPIEAWRRAVDANLWGVIHGAHVFTPRFKALGRGKFLNVSSVAAFLTVPEMAPYNATKSAVMALSETMSAELGRHGIDTTLLCPSAVRTAIFDGLATDALPRRLAQWRLERGAARSAEAVARIALDAVERGQLYVLPQTDARLLWLMKRLLPGVCTYVMRELRTREWLEKLMAADSD